MVIGNTSTRIHFCSPAGSSRKFYDVLGVDGGAGFLEHVGHILAPRFSVNGDVELLRTDEDDQRGGRTDDRRRAEDLTAALADDDVAAIVAVRGGAWLARVIPHIDFSVLDRRRTPIAVFGFSEITSLVNIVASHEKGRGVLDMGPAFIPYGLRRFDPEFRASEDRPSIKPSTERIRAELCTFLQDTVSILTGGGTRRSLPLRVIRGELDPGRDVRFIGGNLAVLTTLLASKWWGRIIDPPREARREGDTGHRRAASPWLVLEDVNEAPYRIDRLLAHLTLANAWEHVSGLLLGDFHQDDANLIDAALNLLPYHLGEDSRLPIVVCNRVGHIWPMSPLPLNRLARFAQRDGGWEIAFDWPTILI